MTLHEIGVCLGATREAVRQIEEQALKKYFTGLRDDEGWSDEDLREHMAELARKVREP